MDPALETSSSVPIEPTVQEWLQSLGLGASVELFIGTSGLQEGTKYLEGLKTIEDDEFRELLNDLEDLDEAVDEMIGEDENHLTEGEAAKLKAALHDCRRGMATCMRTVHARMQEDSPAGIALQLILGREDLPGGLESFYLVVFFELHDLHHDHFQSKQHRCHLALALDLLGYSGEE